MREWMRSKWGTRRRPEPPLWAFPDESVRLGARLCIAGVLIAAGAILASRILDADRSGIGVRAEPGAHAVAPTNGHASHPTPAPPMPRPRTQGRADATSQPSRHATGSPAPTVSVVETSDASGTAGPGTDRTTSGGDPAGGSGAVQPVSSGPGGTGGGGTGTGGVVSGSGGSGSGGSGGAGPGGDGGAG